MKHLIAALLLFIACTNIREPSTPTQRSQLAQTEQQVLDKYVTVQLQTDLSHLSASEKQMIPVLIKAAKEMDDLFWYEAFGDKKTLITEGTTADMRRLIEINYGPWDRLGGDAPFLKGIGSKPKGANFYPTDMTKEEFDQADLPQKSSLYTFIRRDQNGKLLTIPYHKHFAEKVQIVSDLLLEASTLAEDPGLKEYLKLRSSAMLDDEYKASDLAWLDMKENTIDVVIGPIETYEDQLYGYKAAHEGYVLVKDKIWSARLAKYAAFLPDLQRGLPVSDIYKVESPGTDTELNAYDVIYYSGHSNAGSKTIAINLPNDEEVQLQKGTRRLQLKNAMRAKFDIILVPIANMLIDSGQRHHITFDAFFANTMFHEVAHGLGIKNTITGKGTVRKALKEHASALEEGKADVLGLYMINQLHARGEIEGELKDYYVTFLASIFRSVRFGASSVHGRANMIRFNFFKEKGAFVYDSEYGTYLVDFEKFTSATDQLSELILTLQGDGNYEEVVELVENKGLIDNKLQQDLDRLTEADIPVDIVFDQGIQVLGL
ncbi:MAG: hypothetical protein OEQ53_07175 [Saprospiraceae bacterium]|nr:hypothetical protein [Saprospiraceae bacterium]